MVQILICYVWIIYEIVCLSKLILCYCSGSRHSILQILLVCFCCSSTRLVVYNEVVSHGKARKDIFDSDYLPTAVDCTLVYCIGTPRDATKQ